MPHDEMIPDKVPKQVDSENLIERRSKDRSAERPCGSPVTVVTGLPRAGTSMVMQMLAAGGLPLLTDERRLADANNPRGYLEYDPVKALARDNTWMEKAEGKAIKIIAQLLQYLPQAFHYDLLFVERDLNEIVESQTKMLARNQQQGGQLSAERLKRVYENQLDEIRGWLAAQGNMRVLYLEHRKLIEDPAAQAAAIVEFLRQPVQATSMASVVDRSLHRNRND